MNYFVNENIYTLNSGTEFSAVQRLKLFKQNQIEAKILTTNYNSQLDGDIERVGISHEDVINMYDYFQEATNVPREDVNVRYTDAIDKRAYHIEGVDANESLIKHAGQQIGKVTIAPATVGLVGSMEYNDGMNNLLTRDIWDRRGFKSSIQYFHPGGVPGPQVFLNPAGIPKLEVTHMNINGKILPTMYKLLDYQGKNYRFNTEEDLIVFFLEEMAKKEPSVFISDRPSFTPAMARLQGAAGKWQYLHYSHAKNNLQAGGSRQIEAYLEDLFKKFNHDLDGIIVATEQQKAEIAKYFDFKNILVLPDSYTEEIAPVPAAQRDLKRVAYLGRIANEKKPIDVIEIFAGVHQAFPDTKLDFYGYASPADLQKELEKLVEDKGIKDAVTFCGYQDPASLSDKLDHAAVMINTSAGEGGAMNILEAMNHGLPVVSYNVKYGIPDLIENGVNGFLAPYGAKQELADILAKVLVQTDAWPALSQAAYAKAKNYRAENAWDKWANQKVLVNNLFL